MKITMFLISAFSCAAILIPIAVTTVYKNDESYDSITSMKPQTILYFPEESTKGEGVEEVWIYPISQEEIDLIALITMAEAEAETEFGKRLVIDTILNRVDNPLL